SFYPFPRLKHRFGNFKFVRISINPAFFEIEHMRSLGNKIAETSNILKRKILVVASSDFTHYGPAYGYMPFRGNISQTLKKIKEMDMEVAGYATKLMPERLMETCESRTVCGYGAIAAAIWAAQKLGAKQGSIVDYTTSFETSKDASAIVGYCGIVIF
ncbi:MAG: AmmeMemoRadiSam system protein B, partial [Candidatus Aenigmatarchaeota archaeon]